MSKGLESIKKVVEHNIKYSTYEIEKYMSKEDPSIWISSISYFEGIKSTNENILNLINHELKLEEYEQMEYEAEMHSFVRDDGLPIEVQI